MMQTKASGVTSWEFTQPLVCAQEEENCEVNFWNHSHSKKNNKKNTILADWRETTLRSHNPELRSTADSVQF